MNTRHHLVRMKACQQKTEIPYYAEFRFTATFDIPPQIAVEDSGATPGLDGIFKSRVQNSTKYHDFLLGHTIMAGKKHSLFF